MEDVSLSVTCPNCGTEIPLTEAISQRFREESKAEFQAEAAKNKQLLDERERGLKAKEEELGQAEETIKAEVEKRLKADTKKLEEAAEKKAEEKLSDAMKDMREELEEKDKAIKDFRKAELDLLKEKNKLTQEKEGMELEIARKIEEQRLKIKNDALSTAAEEHLIKDRQKDSLIEGLQQRVTEMQRQMEQRSMERQGEALEDILEEELRRAFPQDEIEPVAKGVRGADVTQRVRNSFGHECGTIVWEAKNAKNWSEAWVDKLKQDQRNAKAELAVLLTVAFPKGVDNFNQYNGIWVCDHCSLVGLAAVLRQSLILVTEATVANEGKAEKMETLYAYLTSAEFKQRVEAIVEAFTTMHHDLRSERTAMERIWKKREKQIDRVLNNTAALYGDMQGIAGGAMLQIGSLELDTLTGPDDGEAEEEL